MINHLVPIGTPMIRCDLCQKRTATVAANKHRDAVIVDIDQAPKGGDSPMFRPPVECKRPGCPILKNPGRPVAVPTTAPAPLCGTKPCDGCGAPIRWEITKSGKRAPMNPDGTSHFSTCPNAADFKRKSPPVAMADNPPQIVVGDPAGAARAAESVCGCPLGGSDNDSPTAQSEARKSAAAAYEATIAPCAPPPTKTLFRKVILSAGDFGDVANGTPLRRAWSTEWRGWVAFGDGSRILGVANLTTVQESSRGGYLWEFAHFQHIELVYQHNADDRCAGISPPMPVRWNDDAQRMLNAPFTPSAPELLPSTKPPEKPPRTEPASPVLEQPQEQPVFDGQGSLFQWD